MTPCSLVLARHRQAEFRGRAPGQNVPVWSRWEAVAEGRPVSSRRGFAVQPGRRAGPGSQPRSDADPAHRDRHASAHRSGALCRRAVPAAGDRLGLTRRCGCGRCRRASCCAPSGCRSVRAARAESSARDVARRTAGRGRRICGCRCKRQQRQPRPSICSTAAPGPRCADLEPFRTSSTTSLFSPDGKRLAVALHGGNGMRVIEVASGRELMADRDFGGKDRSRPCICRRRQPVCRWFRRKAAPLWARPEAQRPCRDHGRQGPHSVAVDPAGQRLAVGFTDTAAVEIYDATTCAGLAWPTPRTSMTISSPLPGRATVLASSQVGRPVISWPSTDPKLDARWSARRPRCRGSRQYDNFAGALRRRHGIRYLGSGVRPDAAGWHRGDAGPWSRSRYAGETRRRFHGIGGRQAGSLWFRSGGSNR